MKPTRKPNRLKDYDYSEDGAYFLTICTQEKKQTLSHIPHSGDGALPPTPHLTKIGEIVRTAIAAIPEHYPGVFVDRFVIMPNHVHLLVRIERGGRLISAPTGADRPSVANVIRQLQKGFYDHIIRDEQDYLTRARYIENNPVKWAEDEYNHGTTGDY